MKHRALLTCTLLITATLLAAALVGCGDRQPIVRPTDDTDTVVVRSATASLTTATSSAAAPSLSATTTAATVYIPDPTALALQLHEGWQTYENANYGFVLRYPGTWSLTEVASASDTMAGHRIDLVDDADPRNRMHLAYRRAAEAVQIAPTGMSQGEIVERGSIVFLGETLDRRALVDRDADTRILYGSGEVVRGDLVFWMDLYRLAEGDAERGLLVETQRVADAILSSLTVSAP